MSKRVNRSLVLCAMFCRSLFVLLSVLLQFTDSDYPFLTSSSASLKLVIEGQTFIPKFLFLYDPALLMIAYTIGKVVNYVVLSYR